MSDEPKKVEAISVGMGLRDKFAMAALTGIIAAAPRASDMADAAKALGLTDVSLTGNDVIAYVAYDIADSMMEARK